MSSINRICSILDNLPVMAQVANVQAMYAESTVAKPLPFNPVVLPDDLEAQYSKDDNNELIRRLRILNEFDSLPNHFKIEPMLILLKALAEVEAIQVEMQNYSYASQSVYNNLRFNLATEDYIKNLDALHKRTLTDLDKFSRNLELVLGFVDKFFPTLEGGKSLRESYKTYVQLIEQAPSVFSKQVLDDLTLAESLYYERKLEIDTNSHSIYNNLAEYVKDQREEFQANLAQSNIDTYLETLQAKKKNYRYKYYHELPEEEKNDVNPQIV